LREGFQFGFGNWVRSIAHTVYSKETGI